MRSRYVAEVWVAFSAKTPWWSWRDSKPRSPAEERNAVTKDLSRLRAEDTTIAREAEAATHPRHPNPIDLTRPHTSCTFGLVIRPYVRFSCSGEVRQRWKRDWDRGAGRRKSASANPVNASIAGCHFGSARRSVPRASLAIAWSTRLHAVGDAATRETHSDRSCSFTGMTGRTSSIATTPLAAARRSSYAARRHLWEHHFAGRPVARSGTASPHLGHSPAGTCRMLLSISLMPRQATFRTDEWTGRFRDLQEHRRSHADRGAIDVFRTDGSPGRQCMRCVVW